MTENCTIMHAGVHRQQPYINIKIYVSKSVVTNYTNIAMKVVNAKPTKQVICFHGLRSGQRLNFTMVRSTVAFITEKDLNISMNAKCVLLNTLCGL
jgi:hypothetical protein